ncbi:MAG TPA: thioredoxin family protein [Parachlamydiaceae bacterium]|nr:thioredoxin family protein [Parachlamydiaceae bacterium]
MRTKILFIFCTVLSFCSCRISADSQALTTTRAPIKWQTNYEQAVQQSKTASKPLVLFFTGSDWCGWCTKLDEEAFDTREFAEAAGSKFIFVKLDFPLYSPQDPQTKAQNKELQQKFDVRSFPTVIIVDPKQNQQMGVTGYRPGGGKAFADHLLKTANDYSGYKQKLGVLDHSKHTGRDLKPLYAKAMELGLVADANKIAKKGATSEESLFFMMEQYRFLADEGQIHSKEAVVLKQQLLNADPSNEKQIHYQLAVADFEALSYESDKDKYNTELMIAPLTEYIEKFGTEDKENVWRLQLLVSQVYLDKNEMVPALKYAEQSFECAPSCIQPDLARAVQNIRSKIHSSR